MSENNVFVQSENGVFTQSENLERGPGSGVVPTLFPQRFLSIEVGTTYQTTDIPVGSDSTITPMFFQQSSSQWLYRNRGAVVNRNFLPQLFYDSVLTYQPMQNTAKDAEKQKLENDNGVVFTTFTHEAFYSSDPWGSDDPRVYPVVGGSPVNVNPLLVNVNLYAWRGDSDSDIGSSQPDWAEELAYFPRAAIYGVGLIAPQNSPWQFNYPLPFLNYPRYRVHKGYAGAQLSFAVSQMTFPPKDSSINLNIGGSVSTSNLQRFVTASFQGGNTILNVMTAQTSNDTITPHEILDAIRANSRGARDGLYADLSNGWYVSYNQSTDASYDFYAPDTFTLPGYSLECRVGTSE